MARPVWTYDIESIPRVIRGRTQILFFILRNDNKKFGPFKSLGHAERVRNLFAAWAKQSWHRHG